ncbi:RNA polymerase II transcriptional coactivator KELP-like [Zingiber officinale]|uniref:RNA polymerase II transcriptional coactivator KELP-like n=1 Tax=Zingiber officinale TaxID=94328 RepID=UPI001C4C5379|nr:RNA polymerase II transcriptional coactivator KELP-like [Zingiber officinale]
MEEELNQKIEAAVVEILRESDMSTTSEAMVRSMASDRLGLDLSSRGRKLFVRGIVESFLASQQDEDEEAAAAADASGSGPKKEEEESGEQAEADQEEEEEEEEEEDEAGRSIKRSRRPKEFDDEGDLILCRLSNKRRVTLQDFRGKTLVSIREYYIKDGKELPSSKGISLPVEQWQAFRNAVPDIVAAIKKLEGSD